MLQDIDVERLRFLVAARVSGTREGEALPTGCDGD